MHVKGATRQHACKGAANQHTCGEVNSHHSSDYPQYTVCTMQSNLCPEMMVTEVVDSLLYTYAHPSNTTYSMPIHNTL